MDRAYIVVTFDDGFSNLLTYAAPVVARHGIRPAVFVNGRFAEGAVHFRVLAAILTAGPHAPGLAKELRRVAPHKSWSDEPQALFHQLKNLYQAPRLIEQATEAAYRRCVGDPEELRVHLTSSEVGTLRDAGWEIANHTWDHTPLGTFDEAGVAESIDLNWAYWKKQGVPLIEAVAYPNGRAKDVNEFVKRYLDGHPRVQGLFCDGGVNLRPSRTEWLRMSPGNGSERLLRHRIYQEIATSRRAMRNVS